MIAHLINDPVVERRILPVKGLNDQYLCMATILAQIFEPKRLVYRAIEKDDEAFITQLIGPNNYQSQACFSAMLLTPKGIGHATRRYESVTDCLLAVVIYLAPSSHDSDS